jgi:hypothetical protein
MVLKFIATICQIIVYGWAGTGIWFKYLKDEPRGPRFTFKAICCIVVAAIAIFGKV